MAAKRCLLLLAALVSACAAMQISTGAAPVEGEEERRLTTPVQDEESRLLGSRRHAANASMGKTMAVKGHTVSKVSAGWTGNVVYAIFTSAIPKYHEALLAQLETWAARPAAQGRYVAVGGNNYPEEWQGPNVMRSDCDDGPRTISCKEATLLAEGAARGADWMYIVGEDNYVHTGNVEEFLSDKDPDAAVAYGGVGCGRGVFCRDVPAYEEGGGFCGGQGYIISRGALRRLLADGAPALHAIYAASTWPNDMTTSCQLRKHEARLENGRSMYGNPYWAIMDYKGMAHSDFLCSHYMSPPMMRWLHAEVEGAPDSVKGPLEEKAFDNGCAIGMDKSCWATEWADCQATSGGRKKRKHRGVTPSEALKSLNK